MHTKIAIVLFFINLIILALIPIFSILSRGEVYHYEYEHDYHFNTGRSFKLRDILLFFSLSTLIFLINFLFSFCTLEKECYSNNNIIKNNENNDCDCCCDDCTCKRTCLVDFYCTCGNNTGVTSGLIFLLPIALFIGLFYLNKPCGKNISRIISTTSLTLCEIIFMIISFVAASETIYDKFIILNIIISFIGVICNTLGMVLPQFNKCKCLRYKKYREFKEEENLDYSIKSDCNFTPKTDNLIIEQNKFNNYNYIPSNQQNIEIHSKNDDNNPITPSINKIEQNSCYNSNTGYDNYNGNIYDAPPAGYQ